MTRKRRLIPAVGTVAIIGILGLIVHHQLETWRSPTTQAWAKISTGLTEQQVRNQLGDPLYEFHADTSPEDYYISGYGRKQRPISNKVLIYMSSDLILYVWIDPNGVVEDKFAASS